MQFPRVSVIMPVYNSENFLKESISSILNQTFSDFELLIGEDGSTDRSIEIIREFSDDRIRVIRNEKNLGIPRTLNRMIQASKGEYIARQDSDDISLPARLAKQVDFLDKNPEIGLCGTNITWFGSKSRRMFMPLQDEDIKAYMLVDNPVSQPTIMIRKSAMTVKYDQSLEVAEDYALCYELSKETKLANLPDTLLNYRWHDTNISSTKEKKMLENANSIRAKIYKETLSYELKENEALLLNLVGCSSLTNYTDLRLFEKFLVTIRSKNRETAYYNEKVLHRRCFRLWSYACLRFNNINMFRKIQVYLFSELFTIYDLLHSISIRNIRSLLAS